MTTESLDPAAYEQLLGDLKREISSARTRAVLAANAEMTTMYWRMGREILARQEREGWGAKVISRLSADLRHTFPEMRGLSARNITYMRDLARAWPDEAILQRLVAKLPWGHNATLLDRLADRDTRVFYAERAIAHGWTRAVLETRIGSRLHEREGRALTNFAATLPEPDAHALQRLTRDPYTFDFLDLREPARERDLERALLAEVRSFLLELGAGFAFVGSQVGLLVDGEEFVLDLLFFHIPTSRYVVIDLKIERFRPADAGQIAFYVAVVDDRMRGLDHAPTIGLVLCADRGEAVVRYSLDGVSRPVGVAAWREGGGDRSALTERVPASLDLPEAEIRSGFERIVRAHAGELAAAERGEVPIGR